MGGYWEYPPFLPELHNYGTRRVEEQRRQRAERGEWKDEVKAMRERLAAMDEGG